jgi:outer membrane protein assembly factor BamA
MNTLELSDGSLGGDEQLSFVRMISDSAAFLRTGNRSGFKLRFRAGGALGDKDLPLQKQEALGGFTALRGYDFKELRGGTFSLLGTAEYRAEGLSLFVDLASLKAEGEFGSARTGLGAALNFSDGARLDVAWRTDDQARWRPELRLLFRRTY